MSILNRVANFYTLLTLNIAIVLLAEFVGGGRYFFESGLIHIIAVIFIALAISRIFIHYYTYDPAFEKFAHAAIASLLVFALSHFVEFFNYQILRSYEDALFANVANLYLISLLSLVIGGEIFMHAFSGRMTGIIKTAAIAIIALTALTIVFTINPELISLEPEGPAPYLYGSALLVIGGFALWQMFRIRNQISFPRSFINHLFASTILIIIAAFINIFYEFIEHDLDLPIHQVIYLSHFAFYAALSFIFLAFDKLSHLGGILGDVKRIEETKKENHLR